MSLEGKEIVWTHIDSSPWISLTTVKCRTTEVGKVQDGEVRQVSDLTKVDQFLRRKTSLEIRRVWRARIIGGIDIKTLQL